VQTIDKEYDQLKQEADQAGQQIQTLAQKLQTAVDGGDANAREWLLDLKSVALQVQQEQLQMQTLLQALHDFIINNVDQQNAAPQAQQAPQYQQAAPQYQQQNLQSQRGGGGMGLLGNFMGGGFGQAMKTGVGFGIGDMLIGSIFRGL